MSDFSVNETEEMIGIFDSGVGGLTVVKEIKKKFPFETIIYFGDTARYPWGNKSQKMVQRYSDEIVKFLVSKKVNSIVIACNTASTFAGNFLRKKYPRMKFYDVIDPVVDRIAKIRAERKKFDLRIGVIGTRGTIESGIYEQKIKKIDPTIKVFSQSCPLFVPLVEEGMTKGPIAELLVKGYLERFKKKKLDYLVLGCTHYPLLSKVIIGKIETQLISSAKEVAKKIKLEDNGIRKEKDRYYFSDLNDYYQRLVEKIMKQKVIAKKIKLIG